MSSGGWCTIESDPGVFSELIGAMGARSVHLTELYSLEPSAMPKEHIHGLVFLFKWDQNHADTAKGQQEPGVFFAQQIVPNACATQAILSILLNAPQVDLGEELTAFKAFTKDFPPELKGLAISNSEMMRKAHNSFARPEPFVVNERRATQEDDVFHFISYLPINGKLYELDGLKKGPVCLGEVGPSNWLELVAPIIQRRIETYSKAEIRFNLMAVTADRRERLLAERAAAEKERNMTIGKVQSRTAQIPSQEELDRRAATTPAPPPMGEVSVDERSVEELINALAHATARSAQLQQMIAMEDQRVEQWKVENARRRHNYVPFIVNFLRILAERNVLLPLVEEAKKKRPMR